MEVAAGNAGLADPNLVRFAEPCRPTDGIPSLSILGIPLELLSAERVRRWIDVAISEPWDGRCRHLVTLNPEYVVGARRDGAFAVALNDADLRVADGVGIVYAAWLLGGGRASSLQRTTGVDLLEGLATSRGGTSRLFFLGGRSGLGDEAARRFNDRSGGPMVTGWWSGGTADPADDAEALRRIARSGAHVLGVAYGAPGQVLWIDRNREALAAAGVRLAIGVGGALDFLAGTAPRAPRWMRRAGLEWLYRLGREPWRWRRQLALPRFILLVLGQRLGLGRSGERSV